MSESSPTNQPGVIYITSLPPSMEVPKLRSLLCKFGEIKRVFMKKETSTQKRQVCWVEFVDKKIAKQVAENCNGMTMESTLQGITARKKLRAVEGDIWCMRYLPKFTWNDLEEHLRGKKRSRANLLGNEIQKAEEEVDYLLKNIDLERKRKRRLANKPSAEEDDKGDWTFRQKSLKGQNANISEVVLSQL
jgi:ESF2/ABP1 family protein